MKRKFLKIPIMLKLIALFLGLLVSSTTLFVLQTSQNLEKELLRREEYSNMTEATAKAIEIEQSLLSILDRTQKLGATYYQFAQRTPGTAFAPVTTPNPEVSVTSAAPGGSVTPPTTAAPGTASAPEAQSPPAAPGTAASPGVSVTAAAAAGPANPSGSVPAALPPAPSAAPVGGSPAAAAPLRPPTPAPSPAQMAFAAAFEKEPAFVNVEIWSRDGAELRLHSRHTKASFLNEQKWTHENFESLRTQQNFPLNSILQKNFEFRNSSRENGPALATLGIPLVRDDKDQVTHILLVDFSLALIQKSFANESERTLFLVDRNGRLMAHPDEKLVMAQTDFATEVMVARALPDQQPRRQIVATDPRTKEEIVGAYVKLDHLGVIVFSEIAKSTIVAPAYEMKRNAFKTAGIILSVAIVLIFLFSMTLTGPIEVLATLVRMVSKGNFDIKASEKIKGWVEDEVHDLAHAFDSMTEGLKERDKVKNLFSKFHGSSVAEDLIKNDVGVGGQNKEVTVFFSDIRGFTAFSENRSPEEVVEMLNEYFEIMVGIINRHHGVVDKFIGDAIMAVWGAPHTTETDTQNALMACLEMRVALVDLNAKRASRGQEPIRIGMGLHCGPAISGTIGSTERMEYTVIGDTVNMTSRIEASTKAFGADLLVSQAVIDKIGPDYLVDSAGEATVKGKSEPLRLYKVRGYRTPAGEEFVIQTEFSDPPAEYDEKVKKTG